MQGGTCTFYWPLLSLEKKELGSKILLLLMISKIFLIYSRAKFLSKEKLQQLYD
jgi:hypothetical protein